MTGPLAGATGMPRVDARAQRAESIDSTLSSTAPDVRREPTLLSAPSAIGWGLTIGAGLGALLLRGSAASSTLGAVTGGILRGAALGAGAGAALVGLDRATGGGVQRRLDYLSLDRRAQILFVLSNPTNPWIAGAGLDVARDAKAAQAELFGRRDPKDGPQDAFRHAYAAALFSLRAMRDHDEAPESARSLAIGAGDAHEADGQDDNDAASRAMDAANNRAGAALAGDGRARPGEAVDASGFLTEAALRDRVLVALAGGGLQVVDRAAGSIVPRTTGASDLPMSVASRRGA